MPYLNYFGLENFRVFANHTNFNFAPITILTGTNSSGKSSLIKALLLLKDNIESKNKFKNEGLVDWEELDNEQKVPQIVRLDFTGREHKLASFKGCINENSEKNSLSFYLPLTLINNDDCYLKLNYSKSENEDILRGYLDTISIYLRDNDLLIFQFSDLNESKIDTKSNIKYYLT